MREQRVYERVEPGCARAPALAAAATSGPKRPGSSCTLLGKDQVIVDQTTVRINEKIRISPVRVIAADGKQLGILPTDEALALARESELDLVEVGPRDKPPVCRIMDYGKYKYQLKKRHSRGQAHHTRTKEVRLRPKTGDHDIEFKVKQASQFLKCKDKVQISVVFRGREIAHVEEGRRVMEHVLKLMENDGKVEIPPTQQGRRIVCILAPK